MNWLNYVTYSSWICGGRYISCVADYHAMSSVIEAVRQAAEEQGPLAKSPLLLLTVIYDVRQDDIDTLLEREGDISIHLE